MAIMDTISGYVNVPNIDAAGIFGLVTYLILFILFLIVTGVITWYIISRLRFNKKVVIFEKIGGRFEPARKDRAMLMKYGTAGDTIFYLKKLKKKVPTPEIQTGRNTYWFFLRQDGELINFGPKDFDEQSREMGAQMLDKEMRYARTSLQEAMKERYDKPKFWQQYGALIINIAVIVVIMVFLWLIVDKWIELAGRVNSSIDAATRVQEATRDILTSLNNICSGGSGYTPAT